MALLRVPRTNSLLDPPRVHSVPGGPLPFPAPGYSPSFTRPKWIAVRQRFRQFHMNHQLTWPQQLDAATKCRSVTKCLNRHYHDSASEPANSFPIGSWGKDTASRPPRDVDVSFLLPRAEYRRFQQYQGNRQSALLQDVKNILRRTFPNAGMRGDRQVVIVRFDSCNVEVVPAFDLGSCQDWI